MLKEANYRVIRYSHTPDIDQIQRDFASINPPRKPSIQPSQVPLPSTRPELTEESFFDHDF